VEAPGAARGPLDALRDTRVLDLSDGIAGAYCAKLLSDAGADVMKVEPPTGHPLRSWSQSGTVGTDGDPDGALFRFLAAGQDSVVVDVDDASGQRHLLELAARSDVVIESFAPGHLAARGVGVTELHRVNPTLTVVSITPFGQTGPRRDDTCDEFLLQALVGSSDLHRDGTRSPLAVGGRLGDWAVGAFAAAGALAGGAATRRTGRGEHVDVSALECLAVTFVCYPPLFAALPGGTRRAGVFTMAPGVEPCRDGFIGLSTITVQQWHDFLAMIERHDLIDRAEWNDQKVRQRNLDEVRAEIRPWLLSHTCAEITEQAALFRLPAAPVCNGASVTTLPHLTERALFRPNPRGGFPHPRSPFRSTATSELPIAPAPRLGEHAHGSKRERAHDTTTARESTTGATLPLEGVRVLDLTAFWAGPFATQYLATLGADVIKVESVQRPDPIRFNVTVPRTEDQWFEQGYLHLSANLGKRGITLDLTDERGRELLLRLVATADVVVENFTPRVIEHHRLAYDDLRAVREDIVLLRMPGWGLEGAWRDRPGFASTMEQASGMAWVTGYLDGPPLPPGICDPIAGVHGAFAVLAALEHRRATGEGQQVELAMIDMATNVAAEQIVEFAAYGNLMARTGNRGAAAAPQGVYRCAGDDAWIAVAVGTDAEWRALGQVLGRPDLALDPSLAHVDGRRAAHDRLDEHLESWCAGRSLDDALVALRDAAVPAEPVVSAYDADRDRQMLARDFWQSVVHPVVGAQTYPGWPMRLESTPERWYRSPAPLLGQHNEEVLGKELGLGAEELDDLRAAHVIGDRPLHA
jgi:crotonobetainyl-CoA:carnitine CoA-transferase CaiB-like acyl-CoA transferase